MRWRLILAGALSSCSVMTNLDDLRANAVDADGPDGTDAGRVVPAFVQQNATDFGMMASASLSFTSPVKAGDTVIVCAAFDSSVSSYGTLAVGDSSGDSFHLDVGPIDTGIRHYVFSANGVAGGSPKITVTVTGPPPAGIMAVYILEYSGITGFVTGIDAVGTSADMSSGSRPVTQPSSLVLGFMDDDNVPVNPDPAFNLRSTFEQQVIEDELAATPGTYSATATTDAGSNWAALMAVYSP